MTADHNEWEGMLNLAFMLGHLACLLGFGL